MPCMARPTADPKKAVSITIPIPVLNAARREADRKLTSLSAFVTDLIRQHVPEFGKGQSR